MAHKGRVNSIAFSADGSLLASGGSDQTTRLWSVREGREIFAASHGSDVFDVAFSPDQRSVFSAAADGVVRRLPVQTNDALAQAGRQITRLPQAEECVEFHLEQQAVCVAASAR
ncbi:hypothetical protein HC891_18140 [Candidatus Gracilibacteria bacterium]|nr:hypothetical protein [Candidatus Gracilibacteria bacterium]